MSETAPERPATPGAKKPGKKLFGMDRTTVIVFGVALVGAAAYFLWKRHSASTSATTQNTSSAAVDYAGQLSAIQSELESLMAGQSSSAVGSGAVSGGGGGGYGYPYGGQTGPTSTVSTGSTGTQASSGVGTSTTPASAGGSTTTTPPPSTTTSPPKTTTPAPAPAKKTPPPIPSNVHATAETTTTVSLAWNPSAGATSYNIRVTYQGALVVQGTATTPYRVVNGLSPNRTYTFHIAAVGPGGTSSETNGPAVKTKAS